MAIWGASLPPKAELASCSHLIPITTASLLAAALTPVPLWLLWSPCSCSVLFALAARTPSEVSSSSHLHWLGLLLFSFSIHRYPSVSMDIPLLAILILTENRLLFKPLLVTSQSSCFLSSPNTINCVAQFSNWLNTVVNRPKRVHLYDSCLPL